MYTLGIETSCDETAAAIVQGGTKVLSNVVSSSLRFHRQYGGIVPEIAFRMQIESIAQVVDCAVKEAGISRRRIGLVSVTAEPGLLGSLLVGKSFARAVSLGLGVPLVAVDHLFAHIYSSFLSHKHIRFPCNALVVSGGHTSLFYVRGFDSIELLGSTQDDACGEAFDKVAKLLGLGYPGGPVIERLARSGDARRVRFACSNTRGPLDFSFSGVKTAVLYYVRNHSGVSRADIAASFQEAAFGVLVEKASLACALKKTRTLIVGGGVAVNKKLREKFASADLEVYFPRPEFCTDNAAMVAGSGYRLYKRKLRS